MVARTVEPGVLQELHEDAPPDRLRSIASALLDHTLDFLDEVVSIAGQSGKPKRRSHRTFETAMRSAVRDQLHLGSLAAFARAELRRQRKRIESTSMARSVLILECANAISQVLTTAAALESAATDGATSADFRRWMTLRTRPRGSSWS